MKGEREGSKITQEDIAKASGVGRETVAKIETGEIKAPREIEALAKALDVSPCWLLFGAKAIADLPESIRTAVAELVSLPQDHQEDVIRMIRLFAHK